eukprot:15448042-Alexandrium_andersonii.AAC.1
MPSYRRNAWGNPWEVDMARAQDVFFFFAQLTRACDRFLEPDAPFAGTHGLWASFSTFATEIATTANLC